MAAIMITRLDRYLLVAILRGVGLVVAVLLTLGGSFLFMEQQDDIGVGQYTTGDALLFVLLNLPQQVWELLPISALIGALLGLGTLARGSELNVMRASGLSIWRIARGVSIAGLALVAAGFFFSEIVAPPAAQVARQLKTFAKFQNVNFGGSQEAWARDGNLVITIERQLGKSQFGGMMVFELNDDHSLRAIGRAITARADASGRWLLEPYVESRFDTDRVHSAQTANRQIDSKIGAEFLGIAAAEPTQLPTATLWRVISHLETNGLDAHESRYVMWSRIARIVAAFFAVMLAFPFVFGSLRSSGTGSWVATGLGLGLLFFMMQNLLESSVRVFGSDPLLFAWIPTALMAIVGFTLIARVR